MIVHVLTQEIVDSLAQQGHHYIIHGHFDLACRGLLRHSLDIVKINVLDRLKTELHVSLIQNLTLVLDAIGVWACQSKLLEQDVNEIERHHQVGDDRLQPAHAHGDVWVAVEARLVA